MQDEVNSGDKKAADSSETPSEDTATQSEKINAEIVEELLNDDALTETDNLQEQISNANDQVLRIQAEMQNMRRRAERDVENAHKFALDRFTAELLPVVDNLERALGTIEDSDKAQQAVFTGLELTLKSFFDVFARFKIEAIDPAGQPFDADLHQAVSMVPNPDVEPNTVIEVFQKGYTLNGRLVRPAMVVVSKAS
ncbi:MAG: nucleotide exchange factor GrpE [Proteobacteria bacterium]|jgi:molecular chaperone GrpE|nr:nucleotide exchange factor GrpE [Pseudomonadota bacterium]MDA1351482.1 nucleotide exchange factor GrpE [Pseudomonadota bacterium]